MKKRYGVRVEDWLAAHPKLSTRQIELLHLMADGLGQGQDHL